MPSSREKCHLLAKDDQRLSVTGKPSPINHARAKGSCALSVGTQTLHTDPQVHCCLEWRKAEGWTEHEGSVLQPVLQLPEG